MESSNPIVFLDVQIGDERIGRLIIELFADIVPRTAENFLALCIGNHTSTITGKKLHYKNTMFHKVLPGVFIQGGDVTNFDGSSGESIFGISFEDENYKLKHDCAGMLSAVNSGQNCNNSQFIITLGPCPHLDGSNVVFGRVIKGLACAIEISEVKTEDDSPLVKCIIIDCGHILLGEPWNYVDNDETSDTFPPDPRDLELQVFKVSDLQDIITKIRESGNHFFALQDYVEADRKYKKAIRYINYWTSQPNYKLTEKERNQICEELEKEKISCLLNSAAVALKKGLFRQSLYLCDEVLKKEKANAKAYFRRGKALKHLNDYEGALQDQKKALLLAPNDKCITEEINNINFMIRKLLNFENSGRELGVLLRVTTCQSVLNVPNQIARIDIPVTAFVCQGRTYINNAHNQFLHAGNEITCSCNTVLQPINWIV